MNVVLYDTTLRDGAQREGISFSVDDKLRIARRLDALGVAYIEGGWPGSNPKDMAFFQGASELRLEQATVTAFGSTRNSKAAPGVAGFNIKTHPKIPNPCVKGYNFEFF